MGFFRVAIHFHLKSWAVAQGLGAWKLAMQGGRQLNLGEGLAASPLGSRSLSNTGHPASKDDAECTARGEAEHMALVQAY